MVITTIVNQSTHRLFSDSRKVDALDVIWNSGQVRCVINNFNLHKESIKLLSHITRIFNPDGIRDYRSQDIIVGSLERVEPNILRTVALSTSGKHTRAR